VPDPALSPERTALYAVRMPLDPRRRAQRFVRRDLVGGVIVLAICVGLVLGGNHSPPVIGAAVVGGIVVAGDSWLRRRL
jgi:hypothetical protein